MAEKSKFTTQHGVEVKVFEKSVTVNGLLFFLGVEPSFKTLEGLEEMLNAAHEHGRRSAQEDTAYAYKAFLKTMGS